jgi:SpoVK/Ycf46/Vps4 family AAA+-type ATPase
MSCEVASFKGARNISSLSCYPLKYHKNEAKIRAQLIERGKKFVALQGVNYRSHEGLAFHKKRKQIIKVNINGRVMIDPAIHRRLWPNYPISTVKPKDPDARDDASDDDCGNDSDSQYSSDDEKSHRLEEIVEKSVKTGKNGKGESHVATVPAAGDGPDIATEEVSTQTTKDDAPQEEKEALPVFTDEEYLIASPVVLGFAFTEKLWLEFTVSGVKDIVWNEGAYESLVLEENTKEIVKALVVSHKYHPTESIDDIIQGKGKGLVTLLHGPPGTGKTLMAEGIAELLKCPLYMVTAGELGTDPRTLEVELQKILDIAHAWGAVLLLDEADVFLETRKIQDIHRNALVSIFLRLLEYFQGILFLTTNRVETFDDAFQSRIHIALRYSELSTKAKKTVFKLFIERVRAIEGVDTMPFTEEDLDALSRHNLNGRQVCLLAPPKETWINLS